MEEMRLGFEQALRTKLTQKTSTFQNEEAALVRCFKHFDADNDGCVTMNEWLRAIEKIGVVSASFSDLKHLFLYYDTTRAGVINYHEFAAVLFHQAPIKYLFLSLILSIGRRFSRRSRRTGDQSRRSKLSGRLPELLAELKEKLIARGGRGLIGFAKQLKVRICP
jgi:hypothetical protein